VCRTSAHAAARAVGVVSASPRPPRSTHFPYTTLFRSPIVLERKTVNDGLVEAKYYASVVMDKVDVTQELHSLDVKLENDTIQLIGSSGVRLYNYNIYQKEFTITQFTSESDSILDHSSTKIDYLYLKIPKDLKLINHTNMYLEEER